MYSISTVSPVNNFKRNFSDYVILKCVTWVQISATLLPVNESFISLCLNYPYLEKGDDSTTISQ